MIEFAEIIHNWIASGPNSWRFIKVVIWCYGSMAIALAIGTGVLTLIYGWPPWGRGKVIYDQNNDDN